MRSFYRNEIKPGSIKSCDDPCERILGDFQTAFGCRPSRPETLRFFNTDIHTFLSLPNLKVYNLDSCVLEHCVVVFVLSARCPARATVYFVGNHNKLNTASCSYGCRTFIQRIATWYCFLKPVTCIYIKHIIGINIKGMMQTIIV